MGPPKYWAKPPYLCTHYTAIRIHSRLSVVLMVSQVVFFGSLLKCLSNGLFLVSLGIYLALLISYMYIGILLPTPGRPRGVGHCTIQCGCCIDARGFEIQSQEDLAWSKLWTNSYPTWFFRMKKIRPTIIDICGLSLLALGRKGIKHQSGYDANGYILWRYYGWAWYIGYILAPGFDRVSDLRLNWLRVYIS